MEFGKDIEKYFNTLNEGILFLNDNREVIYRNRAAERILGQKINLKERTNIENIVRKSNEKFYEFLFRKFLTCDDTTNHEITYYRKDRSVRLQVSTCGIEEKNSHNRYHLLVVMNDITDLWKLHTREKNLLSQLRKNYADQMENLRQIAQSVAHEVRNPLVSIGGYVNLLLKKHELLKDRKEYKKYLTYIMKDTQRLYDIVNQVEKYSDFTEIRFKKQNVVRIFRDTIKFAEKYAGNRGIILRMREPAADDFSVFVDARKLRQALRYLVKNAINLASRAQPVAVHYEFSPFEASFTLLLHTHLEKEEVPFLFNPFYSARQQKINFELATAQRIAVLHGGIINTIWNEDDALKLLFVIPREKRLSRG